jgi:hypothetical protein
VARLAVEGRAQVIPVGVWIDERDIILRKVHYKEGGRLYTVDSYFPRFRAPYGVVFGRPLSVAEYFDRDPDREEYQRIATRILDRIYELEAEAGGLFPPRSLM